MEHIHSVYDSDSHFSINPITRAIMNESNKKTTIVQHDHNSERFTFEIPRFIEGHDMSQSNSVQVHYLNIETGGNKQSADIYDVTDLQLSPEDENVVICSWLISEKATRYVGSLNFVLRFSCVKRNIDGIICQVDYAWNTAPFTKISVSTGIYNTESIEEEYSDIIAQWAARIGALEKISGNRFKSKSKAYYWDADEYKIIETRPGRNLTIIIKAKLPDNLLFVSDVSLISRDDKEAYILDTLHEYEIFNQPEYSEELGGFIVAKVKPWTGLGLDTDFFSWLSLGNYKGIKLYYMTGEVSGGNGLTEAQSEALEANTKARHEHSNKTTLDGLSVSELGELLFNGKAIASGIAQERPTETKVFLNDFSYEPNMDASFVKGSAVYIAALRDEQNDLSGKEIVKIEYNFDNGDETKWFDINDLFKKHPDFPYSINVNRSFQHTDILDNDVVCFCVLGFFSSAGNPFLTGISNQNQYGFRVTYYTD